MSTIFTRIIEGDIPGTFVHRDEHCVVFLSINPLADGHVLVVPIREVDHWVDLPADLSSHLFRVAHTIGDALRRAFTCERVGLIVAGYEVNHCHIHVIPTRDMSQLDFRNAAPAVSRETLERNADLIRAALAG